MADGVWNGVYPYDFGAPVNLCKISFFYPSTPSMRKGRDRGEKNVGKKGEKD